jgi:trk system potassium uptake protein
VVLTLSFAALILVGTFLLTLPISSVELRWTAPLDALFTATSAVCVTGLVVLDTGTYWSGFGQVVLLALMQLGGLGFMTSSTFLILIVGQRITLRNRVLLKEALGAPSMQAVRPLIRKVTIFAVATELTGAVLLFFRFLDQYDPPRAAWMGVFHAVSAFTNASFDLIGGFRSLTPYWNDPLVLLTHGLLIALGGISYTTAEDVAHTRRFNRLALDTKLVLVTTAGLLLLGTAGVLATEWRNPSTLGSMPPLPALWNALFHATAARTAGFNAMDIGAMTEAGQLVLIALMFVGGAAGSTAGGIKVQTFCLLLFAIMSALRGLSEVEAFQRRIPNLDVLRAIAVSLLSIGIIFLGAFGTVGFTTGITPETSPMARLILIGIMFAGRLGPLTLALALSARERQPRYKWPQEAVKIG